MRRAIGANAIVRHAVETAYGEKPAGERRRTPFVSATLGSAQGLIEDDTIAGRDGLDPAQDVIDVDGDLVMLVDQRSFGLWRNGPLGSPVMTGVAPILSHAFASGADVLPSAAIEIGPPDLAGGAFFDNLGCVVNSIALVFARSGNNNATVNPICRKEELAPERHWPSTRR